MNFVRWWLIVGYVVYEGLHFVASVKCFGFLALNVALDTLLDEASD